MRTVHVDLTDRHIREGIANECQRCPLALALKDAGAPCPSVDAYNAVWDCNKVPDEWAQAEMPIEAVEWMENFDDGKRVQPLAFDLHFEGLT